MCASATRIELRIDVFDEKGQEAMVLADLIPPDLVTAILQEFHELEYLGDVASDYRLVREDGTPLDDTVKLGEQLHSKARIVIEEKEIELPAGTRRPPQNLYLREQSTGKTFRIGWLPATIGRVSESLSHNELVAADLSGFTTGLNVSRRHFILHEEGGIYYVQALSSNPVSITPAAPRQDRQEAEPPGETRKRPLYPGDLITLERADISLKFVVRAAPTGQLSAVSAEAGTPQQTGNVPETAG
jgi:hypothetical protein